MQHPPSDTHDASTPTTPDVGSGSAERCRASCEGTCDAEGRCVQRATAAQCGNRILEAGEECEVGTVSGWDETSCVGCKRRYYQRCDASTPCGTTDEWCNMTISSTVGACTPKVDNCEGPTVTEQLQGRVNGCSIRCPKVPGLTTLLDWANDCYLRCTDPARTNECPLGLVCSMNVVLVQDGPITMRTPICAAQ